ncbi:hypothetical protein PG994_013665 [Apiospora phragmitis]|uniref:Intradiol ring-cleavage dioxygenases domain-containing protein n=1 Tax=Apiospora phragmitis TaxID=2905665 RepID=A0ABR1T9A6_9PEZI
MHFTTALLTVLAATQALAHPGDDVREEALARRAYLENAKRTDLNHCAAQLRARGHEQRGVQRRQALAAENAKRGIVQRAPSDINKTHLSTTDFDQNTPLHDVFAVNASCVLSPEVTEGPYYVAGEFVRKDVTEKGAGIPLYIDIDVLDVTTCEPVTDVWVEIWCKFSFMRPKAVFVQPVRLLTFHSFFLPPHSLQLHRCLFGRRHRRRVQARPREPQQHVPTGLPEVRRRWRRAVPLSIFPGHYEGRTHHVHVAVHPAGTSEPRANQTIADPRVSHLGQMYFDQDLLDRVETVEPYASNQAGWTRNAQDFLLMQGLATSDPLMQYVQLGERLEDGVLAWLSFGINTTYSKEAFVAATYYETGGEANPDMMPFDN